MHTWKAEDDAELVEAYRARWNKGRIELGNATEAERRRTETVRAALATLVERAPTKLLTFFRAPAGILESIFA